MQPCKDPLPTELEREVCCLYLGIARGDPFVWTVILVVGMSGVGTDTIGVLGDDEREYLLPSPERFWLQDGRLRDLPIPRWDPHQQFHHFFLRSTRGNGWERDKIDLVLKVTEQQTFSMNTSLFVILLQAVRESCTMPMTGLLLWGVMILRGTISSS